MAKYDVYPNPDGAGFLLDVQPDLLDGLNTRVVVPLMPRGGCAGWRADQVERTFAATTIKRRLAALQAMTKWLEKEGLLLSDPFREIDVAIKLPRRLPRNLHLRDLRQLLRHLKSSNESGSFSALLIRLAVELIRFVQRLLGHSSIATTEIIHSRLQRRTPQRHPQRRRATTVGVSADNCELCL